MALPVAVPAPLEVGAVDLGVRPRQPRRQRTGAGRQADLAALGGGPLDDAVQQREVVDVGRGLGEAQGLNMAGPLEKPVRLEELEALLRRLKPVVPS